MPSLSRSLKTIPGTVATSGRSSLLRICKFFRNRLLCPVQVLIHKALIYIQGRRYGQPPPASTGLQWKEVFCVRKDPLWGLECIQFFKSVEILLWPSHLFSFTQGLEYCEERYSQELSGSVFPLRAQATNTRLLSCQTIEKFRPHPDRDDSLNEGKVDHLTAPDKDGV